ncbi:MAG: TRL-like family protein [Treponema sp.]|jgi:hypothetical protein|nr:TRL-like family protein [Treponema sp.]
MKKIIFVLGCLALFAFASCTSAPPQNYFEPFGVTTNPVGSKVGEASDSEGGILQAAQNGGITRIATVDIRHRLETVMGVRVYTKAFIVCGE